MHSLNVGFLLHIHVAQWRNREKETQKKIVYGLNKQENNDST